MSVTSRRRGSPGSTATIAGALVLFLVVLASIANDSGIGRIAALVALCALALAVTFGVIRATRANRIVRAALVLAAQTDSLTGLPNRVLFLERLDETLRRSADETSRDTGLPTLSFIDLDRFKHINDRLGRSAGDQVLRIIADRLRIVVPPRTTVARISGDEYVVFDPQSPSLAESMDLGNRLLLRSREPLALATAECEIFVTASIGIARIGPKAPRDGDLLLRHADTAMYQAKDAGRNCVALFDGAITNAHLTGCRSRQRCSGPWNAMSRACTTSRSWRRRPAK